MDIGMSLLDRLSDAPRMMAQEEAVGNPRGDPWKNDLILDNLFGYCTREMISACRLVNSKLYSASRPVWMRRNSPIKLECKRKPGRRGGEDEDVVAAVGQKSQRYMSDFMELITGGVKLINGMRQYSKFELEFDETYKSPRTRLPEFWSGTGAWITTLKLSYVGPPDDDFLKRIFCCEYTPNLEELDIRVELDVEVVDISYSGGDYDDDDDDEEEKDDMKVGREQEGDGSGQHFLEGKVTALKSLKISGDLCPFFFDWKDYLGCCPKLENLDLSNSFMQFQLKAILSAVKWIREGDKTKLPLKSLSWCQVGVGAPGSSAMWSSAIPNLLKESQLDDHLESLSVYFSEDAATAEVHDLCTMYSKSLKELSFIQHHASLQASPFFGVSMDHLVSLVVEGEPFGNLLFLRELPVLVSLKLMRCQPESQRVNVNHKSSLVSATGSKCMGGGVVLTSLSSFSCDYWGDFEPKDISRLHDWMPGLLRLELQLDSECFPTVCGLWPDLQHVTIFGGRIGDRGIVGLESSKNGKNISFKTPNVTNLQDLRSFVVKPKPSGCGRHRFQDGDRKLSVHSVQHGLSKCRRLERVSITPKAAPYDHEEIESWLMKGMPWLVEVNMKGKPLDLSDEWEDGGSESESE